MKNLYLPILMLLTCVSCIKEKTVFRFVDGKDSGVLFANMIEESDSLNALTFEYIYNGGGVGTADFNNDGLTDIFFAGNLTSSRLYLNRGDFKFTDVTDSAGISTQYWCTGVSVVDINRDGWMDIYISTIHHDINKASPNMFFINRGVDKNGIPAFENLAADLGVADSSYSTQAAFLDYDNDGDLDLYLLTNALENFTRNSPIGQHVDGQGKSVDRLYRNDADASGGIHFTDVSVSAGILEEGWGLGIVVNDFNNDGWSDIYCANDFLSSDQLYINQHDGTFKNTIAAYMNHQEFNGMGVDMADLNNDARNDLVVVDMMPDENVRQKTMFTGTGHDRFMKSLRMNYQPQYVRNVLQRNNGNNTFSDIGYQSGIYATDWSWSALLADFDNDGLRDIFITNGYPKDITDLDFIVYSKEASKFGTPDLKKAHSAKAVKDLGGVLKNNFMFHNAGDFQFENVTHQWGMQQTAYSNGAAYSDFDNDGDLDIVINNLNGPAHLYENTTNPSENKNANYIRLRLSGPAGNPQGIGAKVWVYSNDKVRYAEQQTQRGYMSTIDPVMHFGLGADIIDSIKVMWPGNLQQSVQSVKVNTTLVVDYRGAKPVKDAVQNEPAMLVEDKIFPPLVQRETDYVDYKYGQPTLPHKFSQQGPAVVVGDVNGDGLDDFIVGGTAHYAAKIFLQQDTGNFMIDSLEEKESEDVGLLLFDADNDRDLDLYCVSGSNEFGKNTAAYQDRFYRNDGKGGFLRDNNALPWIASSGSCVVAEDFDHDNDLDLFVGGRIVPMAYPTAPKSYLLANQGNGIFEDVTLKNGVGLDSVGMVTSALFTDFDNDGWRDLVVVGEWMPVTFFQNNNGVLKKTHELKTGFWNSITGGDFDNDGDTDYIAGNLGRNTILQASEHQPVSIYAKDFDKNGAIDPFITRFIGGKEHTVHYRETMTEQVASLRKILRSYSGYGKMEASEIFDFLGTDNMLVKRADWLESSYIENLGDGKFSLHALPSFAQSSPLFGIVVCDLNDDAYLDFMAVGNSFAEETISGFQDAGVGVYALGNGDGTFQIVPPSKSGLCVRSDAKALATIKVGATRKWIVTSTNAPLKMFSEVAQSRKTTDAKIEQAKKARRTEHYIGGGYLSQSNDVEILPRAAEHIAKEP